MADAEAWLEEARGFLGREPGLRAWGLMTPASWVAMFARRDMHISGLMHSTDT